jgi:hypothetical protein
MEPTESPKTSEKSFKDVEKVAVLEDLFYLGYTSSNRITIYEDEEKGVIINATFRTLTPTENRDVFEAVSRFNSIGGQSVTERIETLARAIKTINDMPLTLESDEKEEYHKKHGKDPSPLEQARIILFDKIKSIHVIDALYEAYMEFKSGIEIGFDDVKKKLKGRKSLESISPS